MEGEVPQGELAGAPKDGLGGGGDRQRGEVGGDDAQQAVEQEGAGAGGVEAVEGLGDDEAGEGEEHAHGEGAEAHAVEGRAQGVGEEVLQVLEHHQQGEGEAEGAERAVGAAGERGGLGRGVSEVAIHARV